MGSTVQDTAKIVEFNSPGEPENSQSAHSVSSNWWQLLTLIGINEDALESWKRGDFSHAEQLLIQEIPRSSDPSFRARTLAYRSFLRSRLKKYDMAIDDARESIEFRRSVIGHIALAVARIGNGEQSLATPELDRAFTVGLQAHSSLLLLVKAIALFECGKHDNAMTRVCNLVDNVREKSPYIAVRAQMYFLLGGMSLEKGDYEEAAESLQRAWEAIPLQKHAHMATISLIFGWDFDGLVLSIQQHLQRCIQPFEDLGDAAMQSNNPDGAIKRYSTALSLTISGSPVLLNKRSRARAALMEWDAALEDADRAIDADPQSLWGYERRYAALHDLERYDEAVDALDRMLSLAKESTDWGAHAKKHERSKMEIDRIVRSIVSEPENSQSAHSVSTNWWQLLTLTGINGDALESWERGDFSRAEQFLTQDILHSSDFPFRAHTLAYRSLLRSRFKKYDMALNDARESIEFRRSIIGHIALAVARIGNGEQSLATPEFDRAVTVELQAHSSLVLLVEAIALFECGKHEDAMTRVCNLVDDVREKSLYIAVRAQMYFLLGGMSLEKGDYEEAAESLQHAWEAIPLQKHVHMATILLIFGWDFDSLDLSIQQHLQRCIQLFEDLGDAALQSNNPDEAIEQYSTALSLTFHDTPGLPNKRSKAKEALVEWDAALEDADRAIDADPQSPWGYNRRQAAPHGFERYDEAIDALDLVLSFAEKSTDREAHELAEKYERSKTEIDRIVRNTINISPLVLIDVKRGCLCDGPERMKIFRSERPFKKLVSSATLELDDERILEVVKKYFDYVTFSHVWQGKEPSYQEVNSVNWSWDFDSPLHRPAHSLWDLDSSFLRNKLRKFCEVVRSEGYRWAWSDTCCIDKTINAVLNQSLKMMYKWYEASAATFVFLADVDSSSGPGGLKNSKWMTRAWTSQELLSPKVIRFYDRNWKPYLGDTHFNHKESPRIIEELADAIGLSRETITAFNPDDLETQEKLRLASKREATREEDLAYSLIGIFKSDIHPDYGEGYAAIDHLLEEIVARSSDVVVLSWAGVRSRYNSCLPATLAPYSQTPHASAILEEAEMAERVMALERLVSYTDAMAVHSRVAGLPSARFASRRLQLPCIIFTVGALSLQKFGTKHENYYRAWVSGIGSVEFHTSDRLSVHEPRKYVFVHPWIRALQDPLDGFSRGNMSSVDESVAVTSAAPAPVLPTTRATPMDDYTRALRLLVRLQQSFHALLLHLQPHGDWKRVACEHEIIVERLDPKINFAKDIDIEVLEVL